LNIKGFREFSILGSFLKELLENIFQQNEVGQKVRHKKLK
jgi:hypothetical protein